VRKYEPAWKKLKSEHLIKIAAHPAVHARILKAIIKEKDMDVVYKLQMSEDCKKALISHESKSGQLILRLKHSIGLSDL
jgi:ATP-dependent protease Clp ATPase subunit